MYCSQYFLASSLLPIGCNLLLMVEAMMKAGDTVLSFYLMALPRYRCYYSLSLSVESCIGVYLPWIQCTRTSYIEWVDTRVFFTMIFVSCLIRLHRDWKCSIQRCCALDAHRWFYVAAISVTSRSVSLWFCTSWLVDIVLILCIVPFESNE